MNITIIFAAVDIGFQSLQFTTSEDTSASVCAQITRGSLERDVVVYLNTVSEGTATGNILC